MSSPGGYAKLSALDEDDMDDAAHARSFPKCPNEKVTWPERSSSFVSRWLFIWVSPMLKLGSREHLEHSDLWSLDPQESTGTNYPTFKKLIADEHERCKAANCDFALWRPAIHLVKKQVLQAAVLRVTNVGCSLARPLVLQQVLLVVEGSPAWVAPEHAWMLAIGMMLCSFGEFMGYGHYMHLVNKASWRLREGIIGMLYNHVTELNLGAKNSYSGGKITNLMSSDADRVRFMTIQLNLLWIVPIQFVVSLYLVISLLGPAGLVGLVMTLLLTPITRRFIGKLHKLQTDARKETDERVRYVLECMSGIRILKFMGWEASFVNKINAVREKELGLLRKSTVYRAAFFSVMMSTPLIVTVFTLGIYTVLGNPLTPSVAFPAMALLQLLREPLARYPYVLTNLFVEGRTALERIQSFLKELPVEPYVDETTLERSNERISIRMSNATFRWCPPSTNTAWQKGQRGGWENIVGYKTIVKFVLNRIKLCCGCGGQKYRLGEAQIAAKEAASKADIKRASGSNTPEDAPLIEVLQRVDLVVQEGTLCCVVGKVGSGKTSLLHAILGEMDVVGGTTETKGKISFAAQSAFIMNATLRDNILFGSAYDEGKYNNVLDICALVPDLEQLAAGDQTQIGEKGINLSGGQRQRVALARAVYQDCDIYMLDDPLSAVDAHTGKHIFHKCIMALRNAGKTVILPCHALSFLQYADHIVSLKDNRIDEQGSFRDLLNNRGDFASLMEIHSSTTTDDDTEEKADETKQKAAESEATGATGSTCSENTPSTPKKEGKLIKDEERAKGTVSADVYTFYMRQVGISSVIYVMFCFIMGQLLQTFSDWWMSRWAIHDDALIPVDDWTDNQVIAWFLGIYALSGAAIVIFTICKTMIIQLIGFNAARKIHSKLLWRLMKAPVKYFDVTPVGRIVNRFSSDISDIDNQISQNFMYVFSSVLSLSTGFGLICSIMPAFIFYLVPIFYSYYRIQDMYRKTAREMKRLNSSARSPIFQHFDETLSGLITIRANRPRVGKSGKERFSLKNECNIDYHMRAEMALNVTQRWLTIWLSSIGAFTLFVVVATVCMFPKLMDAGLVGMVINYSMMASGTLQGFIDSFSQLELQMNSVERVKEYSTMQVEAAYDQEMEREEGGNQQLVVTPRGWPVKGRIEFKGVTARYRPELDRVLIDLNLEIQPREKVGIVGRTGSGKSTLVQLLFRILELEGGTISIDGIDIFKMGLKQLRTAIAMLPQDPVLFSGTVRTNLDPFDEHSTATIWDALEKAQMKEAIDSLPAGLDADVGDGGGGYSVLHLCTARNVSEVVDKSVYLFGNTLGAGSFSVGERQLLCLGRAILRNSKVLVMDECTASVDVRTDEKIQEMIRVVFEQCTVFAIAHRLATIIDYDKVVVLEKGELKQFGAPLELLDDTDGIFARLVEETGPGVSAHLHALARGETRSPSGVAK